ncbi:hypothetical protein [Paenibacillus methanolicus]|uniref:GNAT acetyltransferase-like protein n=1 Tax=Paenibacillus methanolicus TaxID=582686 RepID=A0A5S5C601_9BACL|nr:hypothetical protein [Paenibacillus methanolicus]TYP74861.1 hypothetical protein BCM02_105408 [Paenibacillus methanolicus]
MTRTDIAVQNNIAWCAAVCDLYGVAHNPEEQLWGTLAPAPPFYPDLITATADATTEDVRRWLTTRDINGLKDSYAKLDMAKLGFRLLFEAEWIMHEPSADLRASVDEPAWTIVANERELARWAAAADMPHLMKPELLQRHDVKVFLRESDGEVSGFIANVGAGAVGISNVFAPPPLAHDTLWQSIARASSALFPELPLVGYEHGETLDAARQAGWTAIGPLRVWVR